MANSLIYEYTHEKHVIMNIMICILGFLISMSIYQTGWTFSLLKCALTMSKACLETLDH